MVNEPVTALVRPTPSVDWPNSTSLTRYPSSDSLVAVQVPSMPSPEVGEAVVSAAATVVPAAASVGSAPPAGAAVVDAASLFSKLSSAGASSLMRLM